MIILVFRNEKDLLEAEIQQTRLTLDSLRDEIRRLEADSSKNRKSISQLQDQLNSEKNINHSLQEDNLRLSQQVSSIRFDMEREISDRRKIEEKLAKALSCTKENVNQSSCGNSTGESNEITKLKTRISALSQSLLEKQGLVNRLSSEKQLVDIQVERLQNHVKQLTDQQEFNDSTTNGGFAQTGMFLFQRLDFF